MKKIITSILLSIFIFGSTFAYTPNDSDNKIINSLTSKINNIIIKKGENNRESFVKKLTLVYGKLKNNEKYYYIIGKVLENINTTPSIIEDYLKEISSDTTINNTTNEKEKTYETSWVDVEEYQISRDNILAETSPKSDGFITSCTNFEEKWNNNYYDELKIYVDIAKKENNYFLLNIIKDDFSSFEKYYKTHCNDSLKKSITLKITTSSSNDTQIFDELVMKKVYYDFHRKYIDYLENFSYNLRDGNGGDSQVYCSSLKNTWDYFLLPRFKFIIGFLDTLSKTDNRKQLEKIEQNIRYLYKDYCKNNSLN